MGCIHPKLSKRRRRERKRQGLPVVKEFLRTEIEKHKKLARAQKTPVESYESVVKSVSNTTFTIDTSSASSWYCDSPVESHSSFEHAKDLSREHLPGYYRVDSALRRSCSLASLESEKDTQNGIKSESSKCQTRQYVSKSTSDNNEADRPEAPCGFRSQTATIDASPPPYQLPGFIDELDKDMERKLSDEKPKSSSFMKIEDTKNIATRPKATKGMRTPHSIDNSMDFKPSSFSLPGCVQDLDSEIENLLDGNSASFSGCGNHAYIPCAKVAKWEGVAPFINVEDNKNVTTRTKAAKDARIHHDIDNSRSQEASTIKGRLKDLDSEIENLLDANSTSIGGTGVPRPKAAKGQRTIHTDFTDFDSDGSYNLPGTAMPSISRELPDIDDSLSSILPHSTQPADRSTKSDQSKFLDSWMERQKK